MLSFVLKGWMKIQICFIDLCICHKKLLTVVTSVHVQGETGEWRGVGIEETLQYTVYAFEKYMCLCMNIYMTVNIFKIFN